jgi:hypothetical protein
MKSYCKGCGESIGTGCSCCYPDFPEDYGYCAECYPSSSECIEKLSVLNALIDRLDESGLNLLYRFLLEYDSGHEVLYLDTVRGRIRLGNHKEN